MCSVGQKRHLGDSVSLRVGAPSRVTSEQLFVSMTFRGEKGGLIIAA